MKKLMQGSRLTKQLYRESRALTASGIAKVYNQLRAFSFPSGVKVNWKKIKPFLTRPPRPPYRSWGEAILYYSTSAPEELVSNYGWIPCVPCRGGGRRVLKGTILQGKSLVGGKRTCPDCCGTGRGTAKKFFFAVKENWKRYEEVIRSWPEAQWEFLRKYLQFTDAERWYMYAMWTEAVKNSSWVPDRGVQWPLNEFLKPFLSAKTIPSVLEEIKEKELVLMGGSNVWGDGI